MLLSGSGATTFCHTTVNVKRFRGGLVFKAQRLCVSLDSRLESNNEEEEETPDFVGKGFRFKYSDALNFATRFL